MKNKIIKEISTMIMVEIKRLPISDLQFLVVRFEQLDEIFCIFVLVYLYN
jgi:hypothetical protein